MAVTPAPAPVVPTSPGAPYVPPTLDVRATAGALDAFAPTLRAISSSALRAFDLDHRSRTLTPPPYVVGWWLVKVDDVARILDATSDRIAAVALLSMHPNGRVREQAVRLLAGSEDELALPVLLVRTADWVNPVRNAAERTVEARRTSEALPSFRLALGLLTQLMSDSTRSAAYATEVYRWIAATSGSHEVHELLSTPDRKLRQSVARLLVERGEAGQALATALAQDDPAVVAIVANALPDDALSGAELEQLWRSHYPVCRARALYRWQRTADARATEASEFGLTDRSLMVRFLAQHHLSTQGIDVADEYRSMLAARPADAARGLGEVGSAPDAPLLYPLLDSVLPRTRREAVRAIGRLAGLGAESRLLPLLLDPSPAVARAAGNALITFGPSPTSVEAAWDVSRSPSTEGTRRAALRVLRSAGRWHQLRVACLAVADSDPSFQAKVSTCSISVWLVGTAPSPIRRRLTSRFSAPQWPQPYRGCLGRGPSFSACR